MHVVNVEGGRVEVSEESRPAVLEVLCDECESALNFEEFEDTLRKEVLLTIGARQPLIGSPPRLLQSSRSQGKAILWWYARWHPDCPVRVRPPDARAGASSLHRADILSLRAWFL